MPIIVPITIESTTTRKFFVPAAPWIPMQAVMKPMTFMMPEEYSGLILLPNRVPIVPPMTTVMTLTMVANMCAQLLKKVTDPNMP